MIPRRKKKGYFERKEGDPNPIEVSVKRRVSFGEADVMGIAWHGRYPAFFEQASAELGKRCGLSYDDFFKENMRAPIVQFHVDHYNPLFLDEEFDVTARLIWNEGSRLNTEFLISKTDGKVAATGYTVQMFTDGEKGEPCVVSVEILERCRKKWAAGEFKCLEKK
jgi:acyl-CoA thioester hydrolase